MHGDDKLFEQLVQAGGEIESDSNKNVDEAQAPFTKQEIEFTIGELKDKIDNASLNDFRDRDRYEFAIAEWTDEIEELEASLADAPDEGEVDAETFSSEPEPDREASAERWAEDVHPDLSPSSKERYVADVDDVDDVDKQIDVPIESPEEIPVGYDIRGEEIKLDDAVGTDDGTQGVITAVWSDGSVDIEHAVGPGGPVSDTFDIKGHGVQKIDPFESKTTQEENKKMDTVSNDPSFERTVEKFHNQLAEAQLKEGQFSWLAGDTHQPIYSTEGHQETVWMLDDKGNKWQEDAYEGYGVFGGKDFYILLGEMNGLELSGAQTRDDEGSFDDDREAAINLAYKDDTEGVKSPRFTTDESIPYEELPDPESHENQGWFEEEGLDHHDDEDDDYDRDEFESKEVKEMALSGDKYTIRAQSFDRESGEPSGEQRDEVIDISSNVLFRDVKSIGDIEAAYERFWNDLNPKSRDIVKVYSVSPADADEAITNETTIKVDESYGSGYIEADIQKGLTKEQIIKKIQDRYPDIGDDQAEQIYTAVAIGKDADWSRQRESVEVNEAISDDIVNKIVGDLGDRKEITATDVTNEYIYDYTDEILSRVYKEVVSKLEQRDIQVLREAKTND